MKYDYLIVGSGLFGATSAHLATKQGMKGLPTSYFCLNSTEDYSLKS